MPKQLTTTAPITPPPNPSVDLEAISQVSAEDLKEVPLQEIEETLGALYQQQEECTLRFLAYLLAALKAKVWKGQYPHQTAWLRHLQKT